MSRQSQSEIQHLAGQNRYVLTRGGDEIGLTDYRITGDAIHLTHTEIDPHLRGSGVGAEMVAGVLETIRVQTDYRVVADDSFVAHFLEQHPDYRDLEDRGV